MSSAVARALEDARPLIVEAGTGTGKTLAYLVPGAAVGQARRRVDGHARAAGSDRAPRHAAAAHDPRAAVRGGRAEGRRRTTCAGAGSPRLRARADASALARSSTGPSTADDRRSRRGRVARRGRAAVERGHDHARRAHRPALPVLRALLRHAGAPARRAGASSILVNHHLYFADLALRAAQPGARVLPDHDAVIFDEAHQLEDVATEHFGARVSTHALAQLVRDAHVALARMPLWTGRAADDTIHAVERAGVALFARVRGALTSRRRTAQATRRACQLPAPRPVRRSPSARTRGSRSTPRSRSSRAPPRPRPSRRPTSEPTDDAGAARERCPASLAAPADLRDDLATIAEQRQQQPRLLGRGRARPTTLLARRRSRSRDSLRRAHRHRRADADLHVGHARPRPATSRTCARASASTTPTSCASPSPFDYARQAMLYVPRDLPEPQHDGVLRRRRRAHARAARDHRRPRVPAVHVAPRAPRRRDAPRRPARIRGSCRATRRARRSSTASAPRPARCCSAPARSGRASTCPGDALSRWS